MRSRLLDPTYVLVEMLTGFYNSYTKPLAYRLFELTVW